MTTTHDISIEILKRSKKINIKTALNNSNTMKTFDSNRLKIKIDDANAHSTLKKNIIENFKRFLS